MPEQAIVTFTALTPNITPSTRVLILNTDRLSAPIGRASKSVTKGLIAATDNAWFDNPVMSRDHAELVLQPKDMTVLIQDVQSMHGTKVNDEKLPANTLHAVQTGDIVSFGAEVRRGPETFPPCQFRLDCKLGPWMSENGHLHAELQSKGCAEDDSSSRGFKFPDSSDVEDDLDQSLDGDEDSQEVQEDDTTPVESPVVQRSISVDAIDLTRDKSEPADNISQHLASNQIDQQSIGQSQNPIILEGDGDTEDADDLDSDEESQVEDDESSGGSEEDSDKENNEDSENSDVIIDECNDYDSDSSEDSGFGSPQLYDPMFAFGSHAPQAHMFSDNRDIPVSHVRTTAEGSMGDVARNIDFQNQRHESTGEDVLSEYPEDDELSQEGNGVEHLASSFQMSQSNIMNEESTNHSFTESTQPVWAHPVPKPLWPHIFDQGVATDRLPSPSDAAMAKSTNQGPGEVCGVGEPSSSQTVNPLKIQQQPMWNPFACHPVEDKSGKKVYFEARQINRARLHSEESRSVQQEAALNCLMAGGFNQLRSDYSPCPALSQETLSMHRQPNLEESPQQRIDYAHGFFPGPRQSHAPQRFQFPVHGEVEHDSQSDARRAEKEKAREEARALARTAAGIPFPEIAPLPPLHPSSRPQSPIEIRASPELDMTSAAVFNKSKASVLAQNVSTTAPSRSAVRIDDIVEPQAIQISELVTVTSKRKADEISEVLEEEVRVWASKDVSITTKEASVVPEPETPSVHLPAQKDLNEPNIPIAVAVAPEGRASKRLRRVAEALGYTALGGVALFSVLVATAPELL